MMRFVAVAGKSCFTISSLMVLLTICWLVEVRSLSTLALKEVSESCRKASFWYRSARQTTKALPLSAAFTIMSLRLLRFLSAALSSEERLENLVLRLKFSLLMS